MLVDWNQTSTDYPRDKTVQELFEQQAAATPEAMAVEYEGEALSYAELNKRANQLAHYLQDRAVGPEVLVGICVERSCEMVIGLLGILKAGGAYLPLDPDYPQPRLAFMLEDARVAVLLSTSTLAERLPDFNGELVLMDTDRSQIELESTQNSNSGARADNLIYVMYTSGSTGRPKGTSIEHRSAVRLVKQTNFVDLGPQEVFLQFAPISFDASTFELWGSLLNGAKLVVFPAGRSSLQELGEVIRNKGVTTLWLTSALFSQMVDKHLGSLCGVRQLLAGGEALPLAQVRKLLEHLNGGRLINGYGPTENTTFTCCHVMTANSRLGQSVPIGRPISNTCVYILDEHMRPVPVGVLGELYIGGDGLARNYLNQPELTAEKFVTNPFSDEAGARLYRTGDNVRYRRDGVIEFMGRSDHQVKIRGYRIELGEIETALIKHEAVQAAAVLAREDNPGDKRLVAYLVTTENQKLDVEALQSLLLETLPAFMMPTAFVFLDELPITSNGKLNRDALPKPDGRSSLAESFIAPRNDLESMIGDIWKAILKLDQVGIHSNFFSIGGNSLLLAQVHEKLQEAIADNCPIIDLFKYPTISTLASHLSAGNAQTGAASVTLRDYSQVSAQSNGAIAIIGVNGRFPGARDVESFWDHLRDGIESITFYSDDELRQAGVPESIIERPEYVGAASGVFDEDLFDAGFFGYSPRQAQVINPQQRFFLECAWELMERAGYDPERYPGRVGVYAGVSSNNYDSALANNPELAKSFNNLDAFMGNDKDFLATRVSYNLNLKGPGVTLQTACSTSLVATHLAVQGLHDGDCDMAIAGGSAIRAYQSKVYRYEEGGILSPDGHCRAFDAKANGTIGGDGTAVVLLKRLDDALADGDQIYAVIKGSAINNDGSQKIGYTAPAVQGQAEVIADAQARAGVEPRSISYIEAHGTGTPLGDPIEVEALTQVFRKQTAEKNFCAIGSLKTNVGHLDSAAGAAGLIKATLALWHKQIPPSLNYEKPNPQIDFDNNPFYVNTQLQPWEQETTPRRAGVSSFGIGGTNAHVILEEAPPLEASLEARPWQLLVLSAKTATALETMTGNLLDYLKASPGVNLADLSSTLQRGRKEFNYRRALLCKDVADAVRALENGDARRIQDRLVPDREVPVVFMFTGQGSQYPGMGAHLYQYQPSYKECVDQCCDLLQAPLGLDLRDVLFPAQQEERSAKARINQTEVTQSALFVSEYALARLWMFWGIVPAAMIGHSIGEYVAACLSGVMSLEAALQIVATRGRLMGQMPQGSMMAVPLCEEELSPLLGENLEIASINSPQMAVISGTDLAIETFADSLEQKGLQTHRLHTSHAFHSAMMEPILAPFTECVSQFELNPPRIPYISNLSGTWITDEEATSAEYYSAHLRSAVRFSDGLEQLFKERDCLLLEVGPGNTLASLAKHHPAKQEGHFIVSSLRHATDEQADESVMWQAISQLWLTGVVLDWSAIRGAEWRHRILLPTYPFERQRYWLEHQAERPLESLQRNDDPNKWIYVPSWKRSPLQAGLQPTATSSWLLFDVNHGLGEQVAAQLKGSGAEVIRIQPGHQFARISENMFVINPSRPDDYIQLIRELRSTASLPANIGHLWSADRGREELANDADLVSTLDHGFYSLLFLVQALEAEEINDPMKLVMVTSSAHQVSGNDHLNPAAAAALGPCKVIGMEHPHISCRNIDVEAVADPEAIHRLGQMLVADLLLPTHDPVVAYRSNYRWCQAFEPIRLDKSLHQDQITRLPSILSEQGVYIITGGLGGLGLELADYLARTVNARLVLVTRSDFPERELWHQWCAEHDSDDPVTGRINRVVALEAAGAEVLLCKADVANEEQMEQVFCRTESQFGSISGVIHAAGAVKQLMPIGSITTAFCEQQFRPKLQGLMVLNRLLKNREVDFCLVNSSLASLMGVTDFAVYTAAHLFMDAFVLQQHQSQGATRWITINWDNWTTEAIDPKSLPPGIAQFLISPEDGGIALTRALSLLDTPQVIVSTGDLQSRIDQWILADSAFENTPDSVHSRPTLYDRPALDVEYEAPRNEIEQILTGIWQDMLGIKKIGVHDNFFELGGDSVLNIQITARARQSGLTLTPKQVFELQTIAELAAVTKTSENQDKRKFSAHGDVPLTPVQHWFFEQNHENAQHFNQAMMFQVHQTMDVDALGQVLENLMLHHEALCARYSRDDAGWHQHIDKICNVPKIRCFDLSRLSGDEQISSIEAGANEIQRSLDLVKGPLLQLAYFDLGSKQAARLLIVIHHLVIDAVSWRILLEDIQDAYQQIRERGRVKLPERSTSLKRWSERLSEYACNEIPGSEVDFWRMQAAKQISPLPRDFSNGINNNESTRTINACLSELETRLLLTEAPRTYKIRINEILLAALWRTLSRWCDSDSIAVMLEGHGREALIEDVDISRTLGWFTTLFPVWFQFPKDIKTSELIKSVKEQLRSVPGNGMGFGLLRYLSDKEEIRESMASIAIPEVLFLYLGQFDQSLNNNALLQAATESPGTMHDPGMARQQLIDVTAVISKGQLSVSWTYSCNRHKTENIQMLVEGYLNEVRKVIEHCRDVKQTDYTPSDFSAQGLSQQDLVKITSKLKSKKAGAL